MMLSLTLDLGEHETPPDFASRLSTRACRNDMREFCRDFGLDPQAIVDGKAEAVGALADFAGVSRDRLLLEAFTRKGSEKTHGFRHKGQDLLRSSLVRNRVRMCPACMAEDIDRLDCRLPARPHRRSMWLIRGVRTCAKHNMALAVVGKLDGPHIIHDTTRAITDAIPRLQALMNNAVPRKPSPFENYILGRLEGKADASWLDGLPMYAGLHLSLVIGSVAVHGPGVALDDLDDDDAWRCETEGFDIIDKGAEAIRAFLDDLQAPFRDSRSARGPKTMYGRLYDWLAHECHDPAYDPVRDIITDHSVDTLALGPGDVLFGREIVDRRKHSVVTASKQFGLHPKRMRRLLQRANLTNIGVSGPADNKVKFDAAEAEVLLQDLADSISMKKIQEYLNVPRPHDLGLKERGFVKPIVVGGKGKGRHAFLKRDLDDFLKRLLRDADPTLYGDPDMVPLLAAAKRSCCPVMDIVALVLEGKLNRVGRDPDATGFLSVLVDVEEVRPLVTAPAYDGHSLRDVEKILSTGTKAVKALVKNGLLATVTVKNPVTGWMQPIVRSEELERFRREFVSLHALARERDVHFLKVKKSLVAAGIATVGDPDAMKQTLYRRADVEHAQRAHT